MLALGAVAVVAAAAALAVQFAIRLTNEWQQFGTLPAARVPEQGDRIVVFAPHSDDETLGCGGMLAMAARNRARIRVVLVTNGDGYRIGVARAYGAIRVTPQMCLGFAARRQQETLGALSVLGVPPTDVTFLGYPDRGIAALWSRCWGSDELYTSHATGTDHSPYRDSFTLNAAYCGEQLVSDIQRILVSERPTDIYVPHPCDNHSDHYATCCFVAAAVEQLRSEGLTFAKTVRMHTYLVHRGDWPAPKGEQPGEPLVPPYALSRGSTHWQSLDFGADVARLKREAIKQYRTQTAIEKGFLMSFARANELFGGLPTRKVSRVGVGAITVDGSPEDWWGVPPSVVDPVGDYVVAGVNKGGDVRAIYACTDGATLFLRIDCVRRVSKSITYNIGLRGVGEGNDGQRHFVSVRPPARCSDPAGTCASAGNVLELSIPFSEFARDDSLFVHVETKLVRLTLDNTGWNGLEIAPAGP